MQPIVIGATGFLGVHAIDAFVAAGHQPTAAHRRASSLLLRKRRVPQVHADLDDPPTLHAAIAGHDVVVHAAGYYPNTSLDRDGAVATALRQTAALLDACAHNGVRRLIVLSSTATVAPRPDGPSNETDTYAEAPTHGVYHAVKWAIESRLAAEDRLAISVVCPGACLGPWDLRVGTSAPLVALAYGKCPPLPDGWIAPTDASDVGRAIVALAERVDLVPRLIVATDNVRLHPWLRRLARRYGVAPPPPPIPADIAAARADAAERDAIRNGGRAIPARELVDLIVHGVPVDTGLARSLGLAPTPLDTTLDTFDAWARRLRILPPMPTSEVTP